MHLTAEKPNVNQMLVFVPFAALTMNQSDPTSAWPCIAGFARGAVAGSSAQMCSRTFMDFWGPLGILGEPHEFFRNQESNSLGRLFGN